MISRTVRNFALMVVLPLVLAGGGTLWLTLDLVSRVSTSANAADHARTTEIVMSALTAAEQQLQGIVADNGNWDDAASNIFAPAPNVPFAVSAWGDPSATGVNYDAAFTLGPHGENLISFVAGKRFSGQAAEFLGPDLSGLLAKLPQNHTEFATSAAIVKTPRGLAIAAAANIVPTSRGMTLGTDEPRFLVMVKLLDQAFVTQLGQRFVVDGLRLAPFGWQEAADGVVVRGAAGQALGILSWKDRRPGDGARRDVLPAATLLLLLLIGLMAAIELLCWRQFGIIAERARQARRDSTEDSLTGLPNRRALQHRLAAELAAASSENPTCLVFVDLDGFKDVNDRYDHDTGDQLIRAVAAGFSELAKHARLLARAGGDEFVAFYTGPDAEAEAKLLAQRIIAFLRAPFDLDGRIAAVGASIGLAVAASPQQSGNELLRCADIAMYSAKARGKNRWAMYDAGMDRDRNEEAEISEELRGILADGRLELAYQPIVDSTSHLITGVEALARWPKSSVRDVTPDRFIAVAERCGLIEQLGQFVLERACRDASAWPSLRISVNVSPVQLRNPDFAATALAIIDRTGIDRTRVELEVTEGTVIDDMQRLQPIFAELQSAGLSIALDDFGSGYSSIAYLRGLTFNRIKIDRTLTSTLLSSEAARAMVQATGLIARAVQAGVTAEGIESETELSFVRLAGCAECQGYFFARPQSASAIAGLVANAGRVAA